MKIMREIKREKRVSKENFVVGLERYEGVGEVYCE